jgi:hypothetical protein
VRACAALSTALPRAPVLPQSCRRWLYAIDRAVSLHAAACSSVLLLDVSIDTDDVMRDPTDCDHR